MDAPSELRISFFYTQEIKDADSAIMFFLEKREHISS